MARLHLIHPRTGRPPDFDPATAALGGIEQCIIHLTAALARRGHRVSISGGGISGEADGVHWLGDQAAVPAEADGVIAINDAAQFRIARPALAAGAVPVIWFHNEAPLGKELRRGRFWATWRWRPVGVVLGPHHSRKVSHWLPLASRVAIDHGLPPALLALEPPPGPRQPLALFTSQAYRGLDLAIGAWKAEVRPTIPDARFEALIGSESIPLYQTAAGDPAETGITLGPRIANQAMPARLGQARAFLAPGHVSETFCLAAAEAQAMGVPVVTLGIGALAERVPDGVAGIVARDQTSFGAAIRRLMTDDGLWRRLQAGAIRIARQYQWDRAAEQWERLFAARRRG